MDFKAKENCKSCRGSGFINRSMPKNDGKKGMYLAKTLCHCAVEIKKPKPDEAVVPKVVRNENNLPSLEYVNE